MKSRLESIGLRPINTVVDVTNFVLHELGHPLHAFDAAKVSGSIVVRNAKDGETFTALDESEHSLSPEDAVISDESGEALALAGIMGGAGSGVTTSTTDVILESAYFTPSEIRRSSRRLILSSDSSYRFERGSDPSAVLPAAALAAKLIVELSGGRIDGPSEVAGAAPQLTRPVTLDHARLDQLMAGNISLERSCEILESLGLTKESSDTDGSTFSVPSYRQDLQRHIDLVEEIARVHGLDKVQSRFAGTFVEPSAADRSYDIQLDLKKKLAALGFFEAQTIKLISEKQLADALPIRPLIDGDLIKVALPLSEDHTVLRPSLTPGLVSVAARNLAQGAKGLRFFELGRTFRNAGGGKARDLESESLALLLGGDLQPASWSGAKSTADFFDLKAVLASLVPGAALQLSPRQREGLLLCSDILADGKPIGSFAQLPPARCREIDSPAPIYIAELELKKLEALSRSAFQVEPLPLFPGSSRDASLQVPLSLPNGDIEKAIAKFKEPLLVDFACTDLFADPSGEKLPVDMRAITYSFLYRSPDGTLKQKQVDQAHEALLTHLKNSLKIEFR